MAVSPPRIRSISFLPSSHRQCRQYLSLKIRRIDKVTHAAPVSDVLAESSMVRLRSFTCFGEPPGMQRWLRMIKAVRNYHHSFGEWVSSRTINVVTKTRLTGGVDCTQVLANVTKDGYHHWAGTGVRLPHRERTINAHRSIVTLSK